VSTLQKAGRVPEGTQNCVGLEVLTAVVMKSSMFWDITPYYYSSLKVNDDSEEHVASIIRVEE
jgi:hypothetical protein